MHRNPTTDFTSETRDAKRLYLHGNVMPLDPCWVFVGPRIRNAIRIHEGRLWALSCMETITYSPSPCHDPFSFPLDSILHCCSEAYTEKQRGPRNRIGRAQVLGLGLGFGLRVESLGFRV